MQRMSLITPTLADLQFSKTQINLSIYVLGIYRIKKTLNMLK
jgi:hypothetical protein